MERCPSTKARVSTTLSNGLKSTDAGKSLPQITVPALKKAMLISPVPLMYPYPRRYSHKAVIKIAAVQPKQVMPIQKFLVFFIVLAIVNIRLSQWPCRNNLHRAEGNRNEAGKTIKGKLLHHSLLNQGFCLHSQNAGINMPKRLAHRNQPTPFGHNPGPCCLNRLGLLMQPQVNLFRNARRRCPIFCVFHRVLYV